MKYVILLGIVVAGTAHASHVAVKTKATLLSQMLPAQMTIAQLQVEEAGFQQALKRAEARFETLRDQEGHANTIKEIFAWEHERMSVHLNPPSDNEKEVREAGCIQWHKYNRKWESIESSLPIGKGEWYQELWNDIIRLRLCVSEMQTQLWRKKYEELRQECQPGEGKEGEK